MIDKKIKANLPSNWQICFIENCVEILDSQRVPVNSAERKKRQGNIPYYGATGQVGWIDDFLFNEELLLLGEDGAPFFDKSKNIAFIITGKSWVNNHAHVLKATECTFNLFIKHYLNFFDYTGYVNGTTRLKLTQGALKKIPFFLPPFNEQKRIVAKLEKILHKIDTCRERLEKIPIIMKRFRQSVLAAACSGKLTEDWRKKNSDVESANELLKKINKEQEKQYQKECAKVKKEGKRKPKKFYRNTTLPKNNILDLPETWCLTYLGNIMVTQGGIQKTPKRNPVKHFYPYLRVANVYRGYLQLDEIKHFELSTTELDTWKLKKGDLLIVEGNGSPKEIGRCAIWSEEIEDCVHQNHIIRSRPLGGILSSFILSYLNSPLGIETMMQISSSTSGLHTLSVSKVNKIVVPLAPLKEQQEIIRRVEAFFQIADKIEKRYENAKAYIDKLPQSILGKAFRGELVPQDPNDEPASVLLEKIRKEREKKQPAKSKKKTNKSKSGK